MPLLLPKGGNGYSQFLFFNKSLYVHHTYFLVVCIFISAPLTPFWNEEQADGGFKSLYTLYILFISKTHLVFSLSLQPSSSGVGW